MLVGCSALLGGIDSILIKSRYIDSVYVIVGCVMVMPEYVCVSMRPHLHRGCVGG